MSETSFQSRLNHVVRYPDQLTQLADNLLIANGVAPAAAQAQTNEAFSSKWAQTAHGGDAFERLFAKQVQWYFYLYGFDDESDLARHLSSCETIIDCGTGTGFKAAWFARLAPQATVVGVEISDSIHAAAEYYRLTHPNLTFIKADIGALSFLAEDSFDYVNCDQVIHHTENPPKTFRELVRITRPGKELTCYVYRKKALPRELLDEHFREACKSMDRDSLMRLSEQLTDLGRMLSQLDDQPLDFPAVPALGMEGGLMTVQRFIYWNFLKCYWNKEVGYDGSVMTNFDWYAPSQAERYSEAEFRVWIDEAGLKTVHFNREPACYSGRFRRADNIRNR